MKKSAAIIVSITLALQGLSGVAYPAESSPADLLVTSGAATVAIFGGTPAEQDLVVIGIERFAEVGLPLPNLAIYIHRHSDGCDGYEGYYQPGTDEDRIDICSRRALTVLHELGHAWEHLTLGDRERGSFLDLTGLSAWAGRDTDWNRRGMEVAANTVAFGLLDGPANEMQITHRAADFDRFEALTGVVSPRLQADA